MEQDYYTSTGSKIKDFFLGVAITPVLLLPILGQILWIVGIVNYFRKGRRFIAIGMLSVLALVVLAAGACFMSFKM
jgi:hypothetical protein